MHINNKRGFFCLQHERLNNKDWDSPSSLDSGRSPMAVQHLNGTTMATCMRGRNHLARQEVQEDREETFSFFLNNPGSENRFPSTKPSLFLLHLKHHHHLNTKHCNQASSMWICKNHIHTIAPVFSKFLQMFSTNIKYVYTLEKKVPLKMHQIGMLYSQSNRNEEHSR